MGRYSASHQTPAGDNLTIISLCGTNLSRPKLAHVLLGSDSTPANLAGEFRILRITVAPTGGTALTETQIDPTTPPAAVTAVGGTMVEPTYTDTFLQIALNQQATFQWWANPGYEPVVPVGTANGIGLRCIAHGGTPQQNGTLMWEE